MYQDDETEEVDIEVTTFGPNMNEIIFRLQSCFCDVRIMKRKSDEQIIIRANYAKVRRLLNEMIDENQCDIARVW